ncbi:MAG: hypothetical protein QOH87_1273, partial [Trebonia sp.]|nr:hypothetical protein [Trebonia sp.]
MPPGGNVEHGEELHLRLADATASELCWIQDQMISRP